MAVKFIHYIPDDVFERVVDKHAMLTLTLSTPTLKQIREADERPKISGLLDAPRPTVAEAESYRVRNQIEYPPILEESQVEGFVREMVKTRPPASVINDMIGGFGPQPSEVWHPGAVISAVFDTPEEIKALQLNDELNVADFVRSLK